MTEAIKKLMDEGKKSYSANIIAAVVSVMMGIAVSAVNITLTSTTLTPMTAIQSVALVMLSFLCATLGYDKVVQTLSQLKR